jgi:TPR repeat protein
MRLFSPVRALLLPPVSCFVATESDREPFYGSETTRWTTMARQSRVPMLMAGVVVAGIALIVFGPHASSTLANRQQLRQQALNGEPAAELQLALDYRDGRLGLPVDHHAAAQWLSRAAQSGNADAEALLGDAYSLGDGVDRDPALAQRWWQQAAQAGNLHAEAELGTALLASPEPAKQAEARQMLSRAAAQGDPQARKLLGVDAPASAERNGNPGILARLSGLFDRAIESGQSADNLKARALAGDNVAQYQLAMHYRDGAWGVDADPKQALGWLKMSAGHGNPVAMNTLADAYDKGELGLTQDANQARVWRERAASAK